MFGNMSTGMREQSGAADHRDDQGDDHDEVRCSNGKTRHKLLRSGFGGDVYRLRANLFAGAQDWSGYW